VRTPDEQQAEIDRQLDASLGEFDEELRREQQRTAEQRDARAANAAGAVADALGDEDTTGGGDDDDSELNRDRAGDLRSEGTGGASRSGDAGGGDPDGDGADAEGDQRQGARVGGTGVNAREIPSGADDDIIARRLRKAAEDETDPELKEKLWKEYIDYKENTQGG
jgi:hypothetical protein